MGTLYVDRKGSTLRWRDGALELRLEGEPLRTLPGRLLQRVVLRAETLVSSTTLAALADAGVGVVAHGGRGGQRVAHVLGVPAADCRASVAQCQRVNDEASATGFARNLVRARLGAQWRLLQRALLERPDLRKPLVDAVQALHARRAALAAATTRATMRGQEGAGQRPFSRPTRGCLPRGWASRHAGGAHRRVR